MSATLILLLVALVLAVVDEVQANGRSLLGWAVLLICAALLIGRL